MPMYYFDVEENGSLHVDADGSELESKVAAREAAIELLPDLANSYMVDHNAFNIAVSVRQSDGATIMTLKLEVSISA